MKHYLISILWYISVDHQTEEEAVVFNSEMHSPQKITPSQSGLMTDVDIKNLIKSLDVK